MKIKPGKYRKMLYTIILLFIAFAVVDYKTFTYCGLSDGDAIKTVRTWCEKMHVQCNDPLQAQEYSYLPPPGELNLIHSYAVRNINIKSREIKSKGMVYDVSCEKPEVINYRVIGKFKDSAHEIYTDKRIKNKADAEKTSIELLKKMGISGDIALSNIETRAFGFRENKTLHWLVSFNRKKNGYDVYYNRIHIELAGENGRLLEYSKNFLDFKFPVVTKTISKDEAIKIAYNKMKPAVGKKAWSLLKNYYKLGNAKLVYYTPEILGITQRKYVLAWFKLNRDSARFFIGEQRRQKISIEK